MSLWLDFKLFGNGRGMKSPCFNDVFYWLVDTSQGREHGRGALYNWIGGFGAQLRSRQWLMPRPGERRRLCGRHFVVFDAHRKGPRVEVTWALTWLPEDIGQKNAFLRVLKAELMSTFTND